MNRAAPTPDSADLLVWQVEMGADEAIGTAPVDRFAASHAAGPAESDTKTPPKRPAETPAKTAAAPSEPARAEPAMPLQSADDTAKSARETARACSSLAALREALESFEGCSLKHTAKNLVFADGNPEAPLMCVGEAPGAEEDRQGLPFVGQSGKLLDRILAAIGRDRQQAYISNILPWRPPGNRKPTPLETEICLPFIRRHIELAAPKIVVLLGGTAAATLLETTAGITRIRGRWHEFVSDEGKVFDVMPTFHPAYLLRQPALKGDAWRDFLEIKNRLESPR